MQLNRVQRSLELEPEPEPSRQGPEALAVGSSGSAPQQQQPLQQQPSQQPAIAVCYEDEHLAVVWKPAGMPAIGGGARGEPSVSAALPSLFPASSASGAAAAAGGDDGSGEGLAAEAEQLEATLAGALRRAEAEVQTLRTGEGAARDEIRALQGELSCTLRDGFVKPHQKILNRFPNRPRQNPWGKSSRLRHLGHLIQHAPPPPSARPRYSQHRPQSQPPC